MSTCKNKNFLKDNEKGQTFIEFILLLVMLIGISYGLLAGVNGGVASRWKALVTIIAQPTDSDLTLFGE